MPQLREAAARFPTSLQAGRQAGRQAGERADASHQEQARSAAAAGLTAACPCAASGCCLPGGGYGGRTLPCLLQLGDHVSLLLGEFGRDEAGGWAQQADRAACG